MNNKKFLIISSFIKAQRLFCLLGSMFLFLLDAPIAQSDEMYDSHPTRYELTSPHSAFGFRAAANGFPMSSAIGNSYQFFGEWIAPDCSKGLFSLGLHFGLMSLASTVSSSVDSIGTLGGLQLRYQFVITNRQLLVPTVSVDADRYDLKLGAGQTDSIGNVATGTLSGYTVGLSAGVMINIGAIDRETAKDAYANLGITRTYLTLEVHSLDISNSGISLSGNLFYTGLRFEF